MLTGLLTEITAASEMRPYQTAAKRGRSRDATCLARFGPATAPYLSRYLKAIVDLPFGQDERLSLNFTATNGLVKYGGISGISPCLLFLLSITKGDFC